MDTGGLVGNLYEVLGVTKDASSTAIRKAYLTLAVQLHPDKNANDPKAKDRFQTLQKVYSILSDPEK
jgi:curved DNA-binding protein CbpA